MAVRGRRPAVWRPVKLRALAKPLLFLLCLVPLAVTATELALGRIRGEWIKEITHRTGFWGLVLITVTLSVTPIRRITGWNAIQPFRRMIGLFGFTYLCVHFLIYVILDRQLPFEPETAWPELVKDVAKRPYITVGFTGFLLLIPLALTSTKGWVRRLGKRWVSLHSLIYVTALAGVVHFMWSVKADVARPTTIGLVLVLLLALRLVPRETLARLRARPGTGAAPLPAELPSASREP